MGTIHISNSFCVADQFSMGEMGLMRERLTYDNKEAIMALKQAKLQLGMAIRRKNKRQMAWHNHQIKTLSTQQKICWFNDGVFPAGLLHLVRETLIDNGVGFTLQDHRVQPQKTVDYVWHERLEPRYYQNEMIELAPIHHRGVYESAVGSGKSLIMQNIIQQAGVPTLVILPSKDLSVQTMDGLTAAFGSGIAEQVTTPRMRERAPLAPIRATTIQTLASLRKNNMLAPLLKGVGMICIDEVHHAGAKTYTDMLSEFEHIYYRFGFSGTFMRNDSKTLDMWGFLSQVLYRYSAAKATEEGFLTPLKVLIHDVEGKVGKKYQPEYTENYCNNPELLFAIENIFKNYVGSAEQVLILVGRKDDGGAVIHEFLQQIGLNSTYISGDDKKVVVKEALRKFNAKETQILVGSSIIGEGIDIRSTDHLIMAQGGRSEIAITQAVGRAVRLFPGKEVAYLHDFRFTGTKYLESHLKIRLDIYQRNFAATGV